MKRMWSRNELKNLANQQVQEQISSGQLKNVKVFENIVDKDGHPRFIEGDITIASTLPEGVSSPYAKWSLSGTHLMLVVCLHIANGTEIPSGSNVISDIKLPQWIMDKIVPVYGTQGIYVNTFNLYGADGSTQSFSSVGLAKTSTTNLRLSKYGALTLTANRDVRISFDLLIDNEEIVNP